MNTIPETGFTQAELERYNRHIIMPGFGLEAQQKLKTARVLVIGAGGLGSPVLYYLAAAGAGTIGIVEDDTISESNLQRQILYHTQETGLSKAQTANKKLTALNPHINITVHETRLNAGNARDIFSTYDIVVDGSDNFPTRYLVNDACVLMGKPLIYGSIFQFEGQVTVFNEQKTDGTSGPNYRDLYPTPPSPGSVPGCAEGGVLGVLPGIIGSMQALEAIKLITGVGETLSGRLFIYDALRFKTHTFNIKRRADNPLNGAAPTIKELIDYEAFCGYGTPVQDITVQQLKEMQLNATAFQLIDVREQEEYDIVNIDAELIPLSQVAANKDRIRRDIPVIVHCKSGGRSATAVRQLQDEFGFNNVYNLKGGILQYIKEIAPGLSSY